MSTHSYRRSFWALPMGTWALGGGQPGVVAPPPWILKMTTPYAGSVQNTLKMSLAPSALASNNLKLSLKGSL